MPKGARPGNMAGPGPATGLDRRQDDLARYQQTRKLLSAPAHHPWGSVCVAHLNRERDRLWKWLDQLEQRMHRNKVIVALANKIARMVWAVLTKPGNLYERVDPVHA